MSVGVEDNEQGLPVGLRVWRKAVPEEAKLDLFRQNYAYDLDHDRRRFEELEQLYGEMEARRLLTEEMAVDLLTHFGELGDEDGRVRVFCWRYLLNDNGELVEDSETREPIRNMFISTQDEASDLWKNIMIPNFESMPVGATGFTLSAKRPAKFEGDYDMAYVFIKINKSIIHSYGLPIRLSPHEESVLINRQLTLGHSQELMLKDEPEFADVRSIAIFYPPNWFEGPADAIAKIIGKPLQEIRGEMDLATKEGVEELLENEEAQAKRKQIHLYEIAKELTEKIAKGYSTTKLMVELNRHQMDALWKYSPGLMMRLRAEGARGIMLPCGFVDLNFGLAATLGNGLVLGIGDPENDVYVCKCGHRNPINARAGKYCEICAGCHQKAERCG